jgi:hypothetical protein
LVTNQHLHKLIIITLLFVFLLSACSTNAPATGPEAPVGVTPENQVPASSGESGEAAPTATTKPAPRTELEATDPTMVTLSAGKPQLVEFFAFW